MSGNIEDARQALAAALATLEWRTTTKANPVRNAGLIEVGHARRVTFQSYAAVVADIVVTVWASETDSRQSMSKLYALISPGPGSLWALIDSDAVPLRLAGEISVSNIGPRDAGQHTYIAAELLIPLKVTT